MNKHMRAIWESKAARRRQLAAMPFSEKIKILEKLRDRSQAIAKSSLRRRSLKTQNHE